MTFPAQSFVRLSLAALKVLHLNVSSNPCVNIAQLLKCMDKGAFKDKGIITNTTICQESFKITKKVSFRKIYFS